MLSPLRWLSVYALRLLTMPLRFYWCWSLESVLVLILKVIVVDVGCNLVQGYFFVNGGKKSFEKDILCVPSRV